MPNQQEVIQALMAKVQSALLMSENDISASLFNTYQKELNATIKDLMWLNMPFLGSDDIRLSRWRNLQLDTESLKIIANHMTGMNQLIAQDLLDDLVNFGKESYNMTSWAIDQGIPPMVETKWNLPTDDLIKAFIAAPWKGQMFSDRMGHKTDTMARALQQTLTDGIMSGDSVQDIARQMRVNTGIPPDEKLLTRPRASKQVYSALLTARTEVMRINAAMRNKIWTENQDVLQGREWAAAPGFIRVCDDCAEKDGMTYDDIEQEMGLEETIQPAHPNCRCIYILMPKPFQQLLPDSLKPAGKGVFSESISEWEMKYVDPNDTSKIMSMKVQPYEEWLLAS